MLVNNSGREYLESQTEPKKSPGSRINELGNVKSLIGSVLGLSWGVSVSRQTCAASDVTLALALTHSKNICLLNYANVAKVVSTFYLTRGRDTAQMGGKLSV